MLILQLSALMIKKKNTPTENTTQWLKNGPYEIFLSRVQKSHQRCGVRGVCIYHIGPFKRKHRAYYTTRRLLFFIPVDSRRAAVLCVCSCACAGQCLLLFSPYSSAHAAAAAAEHARDELPVIVSSCTSNDTNFVFPAFNSDSAAVDSRLSRIFGLHIGDVVGEILYYYL